MPDRIRPRSWAGCRLSPCALLSRARSRGGGSSIVDRGAGTLDLGPAARVSHSPIDPSSGPHGRRPRSNSASGSFPQFLVDAAMLRCKYAVGHGDEPYAPGPAEVEGVRSRGGAAHQEFRAVSLRRGVGASSPLPACEVRSSKRLRRSRSWRRSWVSQPSKTPWWWASRLWT